MPEGVTLTQTRVAADGRRRGGGGGGGQVKEAKWRSTRRARAKEGVQGAVTRVQEEDDDFLATPREKACLMRRQREGLQGVSESLEGPVCSFDDAFSLVAETRVPAGRSGQGLVSSGMPMGTLPMRFLYQMRLPGEPHPSLWHSLRLLAEPLSP